MSFSTLRRDLQASLELIQLNHCAWRSFHVCSEQGWRGDCTAGKGERHFWNPIINKGQKWRTIILESFMSHSILESISFSWTILWTMQSAWHTACNLLNCTCVLDSFWLPMNWTSVGRIHSCFLRQTGLFSASKSCWSSSGPQYL